MIEESWKAQLQQTAQDGQKLLEQRKSLGTQIRATVDRMKVVTSVTAIIYMEKGIVSADKQIKEFDGQLANKAENAVDVNLMLQDAKYLL